MDGSDRSEGRAVANAELTRLHRRHDTAIGRLRAIDVRRIEEPKENAGGRGRIMPITVPSLRERREDLPELARDILRRLAADLGHREVELASDAIDALYAYPFPGNVRELRNVLERAVLISGTDLIRRADLAFLGGRDEGPGLVTGDLTLQELEERQIERVYRDEAGNVERCARRLGIPRSSLYQKLRRLGLTRHRQGSPV